MKSKKSFNLTLDKFINLSLYSKKNGYYMKKNPFGKKGDFVTAPKISRLFSEMIAIWIISFWKSLGAPKKFNLIELGAGDGEMMKVLLESFKNFPDFLSSCNFFIHEKSPNLIKTDLGQVTAEYVVHATNGYHSNLNQIQSAHVMPINNYLVATAPLDNPHEILAKNIAVADSRFVLNYYRLTNDNRLIFGGGESYGVKFPRDIFSKVRKPLTETFPQLENVNLTHAWGGTLGITTTRLPMFAKVGRKQLAAAGYSGHGVALASFAGQVLAETISGNASQFDLLSDLPHPAFPGGQTFRSPIMTLAMTWFSLRDRVGI